MGPVPLNVRAVISGDAGIKGSVSVGSMNRVWAQAGPTFSLKLNAEAGVDVVVASFGVGLELVFVEFNNYIQPLIQILTSKPYAALELDIPATISILSGRFYLWAKALGISYDLTLVDWRGWVENGRLFPPQRWYWGGPAGKSPYPGMGGIRGTGSYAGLCFTRTFEWWDGWNSVMLRDCNYEHYPTKTFTLDGSGYIRFQGNTAKCLTSSGNNGDRLLIGDCGTGAVSTWQYDTGTQYIRARNNPSKCMTLNTSSSGPGGEPDLIIDDCEKTFSQHWFSRRTYSGTDYKKFYFD